MAKYRVVKIQDSDLNYKSLSGVAHIVEADSEGLAIRSVAVRAGLSPDSFQAERVIMSDADRHAFLSSTMTTAPMRRI